jgi:cysteine dioxygenase
VRLDDLVLAARHYGPEGVGYNDLIDLVAHLELSPELVEVHLKFDPERYARNLILRTQAFELLALCWLPGQQTIIHDHGGSVGVARAYRGNLTSRLFAAPDGQPARMAGVDVVAPGDSAAVDRPDIHQLANAGPEELVTIHVYSPPLTTVGMYSTESPERSQVTLRYSVQDDLS